jgi:hypothetical protein
MATYDELLTLLRVHAAGVACFRFVFFFQFSARAMAASAFTF